MAEVAAAAVATRREGRAWLRAVAVLAGPRLLSALYNLVHDCDEVFNYWEPLHYLLYGHGLQTWEYSARFCLRSYAYLGLHALPALPARPLGRRAAFLVVRGVLGALSAAGEASLCTALSATVGRQVGAQRARRRVC